MSKQKTTDKCIFSSNDFPKEGFGIFWYGYVGDFDADDFANNRVFFTSKSNLIAGSNDSFGEQTLLADLLDE